jgi:hypothetical protein
MSADEFRVILAHGKVLFDENDVESFGVSTGMFVLKPACSKRLVSNWSAFIKDDERVKPEGEYFDAAEKNTPFQAVLGSKEEAKGIVASLNHLYAVNDSGVILYGDMPLVQDDRAHLGIGRMTGDLKDMVERGPEHAFKPVLGPEVADHFKKLGKLK